MECVTQGHRADAERARALLEAEAARRAKEALLRQNAEAERAELENLAIASQRDLDKAAKEQAKVEEAVATTAAQAPVEQEQIVVAQATAATQATDLSERETRVLIDAQLRDAGWEVNSQTLRWPSGARPEKVEATRFRGPSSSTSAGSVARCDETLDALTRTVVCFHRGGEYTTAKARVDVPVTVLSASTETTVERFTMPRATSVASN